jgi:hypothetical protein
MLKMGDQSCNNSKMIEPHIPGEPIVVASHPSRNQAEG